MQLPRRCLGTLGRFRHRNGSSRLRTDDLHAGRRPIPATDCLFVALVAPYGETSDNYQATLSQLSDRHGG